MKSTLSFILLVSFLHQSLAQISKPDLTNLNSWRAVNRNAELINDGNRKAVQLNAVPGDGLLILEGSTFTAGVIEFDVKGKNVLQQSFVGFAFHIRDEKTYDAVYFRPFNFMNADTSRRSRSVQYISHPQYTWDKLRADHPGKYENKVNPVPQPDDWFHVKIVVEGNSITVFVDNSSQPSLSVQQIGDLGEGKLGFWVGNNSDGSFANLMIRPSKK
jgi:hypothetical protein